MSKSSNWESTIKPIVVLSVISLIASLLLALVNGMTAPVIAENTKRTTLAAYVGVLPSVSDASELEEVTDYTTAGITINENADPDVVTDLLLAYRKAFPDRPEFRHMEGNSSAHARASAMGSSVTIPVRNGRLVLGTWQGVYFCEFDGPRRRTFYVSVIAG